MASPEAHFDQAEHNERAARSVERNYPDWAVTMYFYAALHWVERYAKLNGCDIERDYPDGRSRHECRRMYIDDVAYEQRRSTLRRDYEDLESESRKARYLEDLDSNARTYYTENRQKMTDSAQKLQRLKRVLNDLLRTS
jgi:hypothetical protein